MVHSSGVGAPTVTKESSYTPSAEVQSTTASRTNDISIVVIWRLSFKNLTKGGGERHRGHRSVIYAGDVGSAVEWRQIKLKTSCDVPAPLNHLGTTTFDQRTPTFVPTLVSFPDLKHFPKNFSSTLFVVIFG